MKGGEWMHFYYDAQGRPAAVDYNGTQYIYLHNLQGDVVGLVDMAGVLVVEYKYDAWGKIIGRAGSLVGTLGYLNPFRYRGYIYDEETGLYYLRSRYYNPEWGRFINADVLMGDVGALLSHNLFAYCGNSPVVNRDIDGFLWVCCFDDNGFETSFTMKALSIGGGVIAGNVYAYAESPHHKNGGTIEEAILFISVDAAVNYISRGIMQKINMLADAYRHLAQGAGYGNIFAWGVKILTLAAGEVASMFAELVINGFGRREYEETSDEEFVESVVFEAIMSADWIARVLSPWATEVVGLLHDGCQERIVDGMKKIWK